jgi:hypothetical protein
VEDGVDFVAELRADGTLHLREEPVDRHLRRGEILPSLVLDLKQLWTQRKKTPEVEDWLTGLERALPIADFKGTPEQVGYQVKVWILNYLKPKNDT